MATPKQTDPQFKLRMTPEIKDAIEKAAIENNRSMNAEIMSRLEASFLPSVAKAIKKEASLASDIEKYREEMRLLREQLKDLDQTISRADRILAAQKAKKPD